VTTHQPAGSAGRTASPSISAVVPMFNEAASAAPFLAALRDRLASLTPRFEIVVVNDGSRDATRREVLAVAPACGVHYLELSRNFGKEAALGAGLEAARGEVVVLIDGDGQHPVDLIPAMLARWREGVDMVYGVRAHRRGETWLKRLGTATFYRLLGLGSPVEIPPGAGDFRLLDRKVVEALKRLPERTRFLKGLYGWVGFRSEPIAFEVAPRAAGRSAYGLGRLAGLALVGLTAFTNLPLRAVGVAGALISCAALAYGAWVVIEDLVYDIPVPGYPTLAVSIMFFSGVQLLSLGIIGEYVGRIFEEVKRRPHFLVGDAADHSPLRTDPPAHLAPRPDR
jgi:glycosyltransferase involved in cell wall biosynthesis